MKILYALQGTGNGHICRAKEIVPLLMQHGEVDVLISGTQCDIDPGFPVKNRLHGLGFIFGKKGGVDIMATYRKNNLASFSKEVQELPVEDYDMVINDFEPVSAWACYFKKKPCVGLSHQYAVLNKWAPRSKKADPVGRAVLKYYAPVSLGYGLHFDAYDKQIYPPVIREDVRMLHPQHGSHYTVYLPAYDDNRIISMLSLFKEVQWQVFSKHSRHAYDEQNISIRPITSQAFLESMSTAAGVLCGAGFETPAEAMYLEKKLMVIPMKGQYEQQCNAAALKKMGIPVLRSLKKKHASKIEAWLQSAKVVPAHYPHRTAEIIETLIKDYPVPATKPPVDAAIPSAKKFSRFILAKILTGISR
jgi:uncharacterized protein (TIGR00661 family)